MAVYFKGKRIAPVKLVEMGSSGGANGEYNIEVIEEEDGTQTLNITDWDYVPAPSYDPIFANNTPEQISKASKEIAENGYTSSQVAEIYGWNLGDVIPITLTSGEVIEMQLIGINHDILSSDHISKVGLTLQMKNCLATRYMMNSELTSEGGYPASELKTSIIPTLKALIPQEWQNIMKVVDKKSADGGFDFTGIVTTEEDLFLFAEVEIFGTITYAKEGGQEGVIYEYWVNKISNDRIKMQDNNGDGMPETSRFWWLRSCYARSGNQFCGVSTSGNSDYASAYNNHGISFGFCV